MLTGNGFSRHGRCREANASMPEFRLRHRLPDFGAAIRALIDEVDLRHTPMRLDVSHIHRQQSKAAGAEHRSALDFVMLDVGWHVGSPSKRKHFRLQPQANLIASGGWSSSTLSNVHGTVA